MQVDDAGRRLRHGPRAVAILLGWLDRQRITEARCGRPTIDRWRVADGRCIRRSVFVGVKVGFEADRPMSFEPVGERDFDGDSCLVMRLGRTAPT